MIILIRWHFAEFSRQAKKGKLYVDGTLMNEASAFGPANNIEVVETFHLGGLPQETLDLPVVQRNLKVSHFPYFLFINKFIRCFQQFASWIFSTNISQFKQLKRKTSF